MLFKCKQLVLVQEQGHHLLCIFDEMYGLIFFVAVGHFNGYTFEICGSSFTEGRITHFFHGLIMRSV